MTYSHSNTPLYVSEGDYIQFRFKAPPIWDYSETVTILIGDLPQYWVITTVPEDFTPDPFPFQAYVDNVELDTLFTYADGSRSGEEVVVVSGLTPTTQAAVSIGANVAGGIDVFAMRIDYDGDGTYDTGWIQGDGTEVVENGAKIQIRGKTQNFNNQFTRVTLNIGTANEVWNILSKSVPLNIPEPFPTFTDLVGLDTNIDAYSNIVRIQGLIGPADISVDGDGEWAVSSVDTTTTNGEGFDVLDGVTFSGSTGTVNNGDYLQLKLPTSPNPQTGNNTTLSIGDGASLSMWTITTGSAPSSTPNGWSYTPLSDVVEDALIASESRPLAGISGLGTDPGTGQSISVPVNLVSTDSTEVRVKVNSGSVGTFPTSVQNGDRITLYMRSSPDFSDGSGIGSRTMQISVGDLDIPSWSILTSTGPDYDAQFNQPGSKVNQVPGTYVSSSPVTITSINRPITITATNGALIGIDAEATPVVGPRTFDPAVNTSFYLVLLTPQQLGTTEFTDVIVGTEATDIPSVSFTWSIQSYVTVPPAPDNLGVWYSKKTQKFDGYPIGSVLSILKENVVVGYGDLDGTVALGTLDARYPGFIECDGRDLDPNLYTDLYNVIGTQYGGTVVESVQSVTTPPTVVNGQTITTTYETTIFSGSFKVPDYRNRRLCGVGLVDASRGNSAFLPITTGSGIFDVGAEGGYWYFDKVDTSGSNPLEQIEGTGTTGLDSQFFSLGTVRLENLNTIVDDIPFTITGSVSAQVGPLSDVLPRVPVHEHQFVSATPDGEEGDPVIAWSTRALFGLGQNPSTQFAANIETGGSEVENAWVAENWVSWVSGVSPNFSSEMQRYLGDQWDDFTTFAEDYMGTSKTGANGDPTTYITVSGSYMVWWISDLAELSGATLQGSGGNCAACIDVRPLGFALDSYIPASGQTNSHSHMITEDVVGNPNTDFTGGNVSGAGIIGGGFGSGLGGASTSKQVVFSQSDIFMDMTDAEFKFSSSFKKPTPDITMRPQRQVPIINPFHKTKYIIKAF